MKVLVGIPTLTRADLLLRNKSFLEGVKDGDGALIIDNGHQEIEIDVPVYRPPSNLGVSGSWNRFLRIAFEEGCFGSGTYDALVLLQDDIIWDKQRLEAAKALLMNHREVDLFLSLHLFSVQVHRRENVHSIGLYDEQFSPAWCEDDDYALTMTAKGRIYQRFQELDPLPGSICGGTAKVVAWEIQKRKLVKKWGFDFGVNSPETPYYMTNKGFSLESIRRVP